MGPAGPLTGGLDNTYLSRIRHLSLTTVVHGITRIERVMTDNTFSYPYGTTFLAVLADLGARQKFIRPQVDALSTVARLVHRLGFDPVPAGDLEASGVLEPGSPLFGRMLDAATMKRLLASGTTTAA